MPLAAVGIGVVVVRPGLGLLVVEVMKIVSAGNQYDNHYSTNIMTWEGADRFPQYRHFRQPK